MKKYTLLISMLSLVFLAACPAQKQAEMEMLLTAPSTGPAQQADEVAAAPEEEEAAGAPSAEQQMQIALKMRDMPPLPTDKELKRIHGKLEQEIRLILAEAGVKVAKDQQILFLDVNTLAAFATDDSKMQAMLELFRSEIGIKMLSEKVAEGITTDDFVQLIVLHGDPTMKLSVADLAATGAVAQTETQQMRGTYAGTATGQLQGTIAMEAVLPKAESALETISEGMGKCEYARINPNGWQIFMVCDAKPYIYERRTGNVKELNPDPILRFTNPAVELAGPNASGEYTLALPDDQTLYVATFDGASENLTPKASFPLGHTQYSYRGMALSDDGKYIVYTAKEPQSVGSLTTAGDSLNYFQVLKGNVFKNWFQTVSVLGGKHMGADTNDRHFLCEQPLNRDLSVSMSSSGNAMSFCIGKFDCNLDGCSGYDNLYRVYLERLQPDRDPALSMLLREWKIKSADSPYAGWDKASESGGTLAGIMTNDGKYVAYDTNQRLLPQDQDDDWDVYLYDIEGKGLILVSAGLTGHAYLADVAQIGDKIRVVYVGFSNRYVIVTDVVNRQVAGSRILGWVMYDPGNRSNEPRIARASADAVVANIATTTGRGVIGKFVIDRFPELDALW
jgi:hypothetical protein